MTQTLDVRMENAIPASGSHSVQAGKAGAEPARNGSSFLAMIEKMIAGSREGALDAKTATNANMAGRGAGDTVPGDGNTLIKPGAGKKNTLAAMKKAGTPAEIALAGTGNPTALNETLPETGLVSPKRANGAVAVRKTVLAEETPTDGAVPEREKAETTSNERESDVLAAVALRHTEELPVSAKHGAVRSTVAQNGELTGSIDASAKKPGDASAQPEKTERKDRKASISVRDNRHDAVPETGTDSPLVKSTEFREDGSADMSISFRPAEHSSAPSGENARMIERKDGEGQNFASMLSSELRDNAADFVKAGQIVLRDNNAGTIRLTLHPESLGNVRISLELSDDKRISGKIVVSSKEAYEAFNESLSGLSDAFVAGGFESAGFDLSWSGSGEGSAGNNDARTAAITPFYASSIPDVMSVAESADIQGNRYGSSAMRAINVFA